VVAGVGSVSIVAIMGLAGFVIGNIIAFYVHQSGRAHRGGRTWPTALFATVRNDMGYWGGQISHIGIVLAVVAIATTSVLATRTEVPLAVGETAVVDNYCVQYLEPFSRTEPERNVFGARVAVLDRTCSTVKTVLEPRLHEYTKFGQVIATPSVWTGWVDDVYLNIAATDDDGIRLKVLVFPLQWLLWVGGFVIVAGAVLALGRKPRDRVTTSNQSDERKHADA